MNSFRAQNKQTKPEIGNMEAKFSEENASDPGNHSLTGLKYFQTDKNEN
jgi:hypothetical protein